MKNIKAVIFDMDGVILDNNDWHLKAWLEFARMIGIDLREEEAFTRIFGKTNREIILDAYPDTSETQVEKWSQEKEALYRDMYTPHFALAEGLLPFLEKLHTNNLKIGVASNAPIENVNFALDNGGIRKYFQAILHAGLVEKPKPAPEIYLKASAMLGFQASECLVIEDSPTGLKAAKAASCPSVGITSTFPVQTLAEFTDRIIGHFDELAPILFSA